VRARRIIVSPLGIRPAGLIAVAALLLALSGCAGGQPRPAQERQAGRPAPSSFGWFHPGPAPGTWLRASLAGRRATLSYPGSLRLMHGDPGTVTVGSTSRSGAVLVYLNVTPRQGDETLRGWPSFRVDHLRGEGQTGVRVDGMSPSLDFRGGRGRCVIDNYTTKIHDNHYREIACYVQGAHAASVIVVAAPDVAWQATAALLEKVVSSYQAG
jgi:hypothetical protein